MTEVLLTLEYRLIGLLGGSVTDIIKVSYTYLLKVWVKISPEMHA